MKVIDSLCEVGFGHNEDRFGHSEKAAWVIDGATALRPAILGGSLSDPAWFAEQISSQLSSSIEDMRLNIFDVVRNATNNASQKFIGLTNCRPEEVPTAAIILLREDEDKIVLYGIADCGAVVRTKTKTLYLVDDRNDKPQKRQIDAITRAFEGGAQSFSEARDIARSAMIQERELFGREFFALGGIDYTDRGLVWEINKEDVECVLLGSDGFLSSVFLYNIYNNYSDLMDSLITKEQTLHSIWKKKFEIEGEDTRGLLYPRTKQGDDSAALLLSFNSL